MRKERIRIRLPGKVFLAGDTVRPTNPDDAFFGCCGTVISNDFPIDSPGASMILVQFSKSAIELLHKRKPNSPDYARRQVYAASALKLVSRTSRWDQESI